MQFSPGCGDVVCPSKTNASNAVQPDALPSFNVLEGTANGSNIDMDGLPCAIGLRSWAVFELIKDIFESHTRAQGG